MNENDLYHFGEWIFPICRVKEDPKNSNNVSVEKIHGTGFFIGAEGFFLSALHVIGPKDIEFTDKTTWMAALPTIKVNQHLKYIPIKVLQVEAAPNKHDIAIGRTNYKTKPFFSARGQIEGYGFEDLHCFGYPERTSTLPESNLIKFNPRFLKGYITRRLDPGDPSIPGVCPPGYELNFSFPLGISGSPLFRSDRPYLGRCCAWFYRLFRLSLGKRRNR